MPILFFLRRRLHKIKRTKAVAVFPYDKVIMMNCALSFFELGMEAKFGEGEGGHILQKAYDAAFEVLIRETAELDPFNEDMDFVFLGYSLSKTETPMLLARRTAKRLKLIQIAVRLWINSSLSKREKR